MAIAVYIISPNDKIEDFESGALVREYGGSKVFIGELIQDVRSIVFVDGSPSLLKKKIEDDKTFEKEWEDLKSRVQNMLHAFHLGDEDLRIFIHFGGQGVNEAVKFNKMLGQLKEINESDRCYAISFGNKFPDDLFSEGKFFPPNGDKFYLMCRNLQDNILEDFAYLRSLRIMLLSTLPDGKNNYDIWTICNYINDFFGENMINQAVSAKEKDFITKNPFLQNIFHVNGNNNSILMPFGNINAQDYKNLLKILEREESHR